MKAHLFDRYFVAQNSRLSGQYADQMPASQPISLQHLVACKCGAGRRADSRRRRG